MKNISVIGFLFLVLGLAVSSFSQHTPQLGVLDQGSAEPVKSVVNYSPTATVRQFEMIPAMGAEMDARPITSDIEMDFFSFEPDGFTMYEGSAIYLRAAYDWASANGRIETRVGFTEMMMNIKDMDIGFNHILSGKAYYNVLASEKQNLKVGASSDIIMLSSVITDATYPEMDSPFATNWGLNASIEQFIGNNQKTVGGIMLQQSFVNRSMSTDLSFAGLWGMAFAPQMAVNVDMTYRRTLLALAKTYSTNTIVTTDSLGAPQYTIEEEWGDYKKVDFGSMNIEPHALTLGVIGTYYLTDRLGINAGLRKMFLVKDYSSTTLLIGGRASF